jgi:hypothetical protein
MINYAPFQIHPINIPSVTDMDYLEAYGKELKSNRGYSIVRCTADIINESGASRTGTYVFRVPTDQDSVEFIKQYTKSDPKDIVTYFLDEGYLTSYDGNKNECAYYSNKGEQGPIACNMFSVENGIDRLRLFRKSVEGGALKAQGIKEFN